jgi:plasmid stability protein
LFLRLSRLTTQPDNIEPFRWTTHPIHESILLSYFFTMSLEAFMSDLLIRGLDDTIIDRLRRRAERHHRSLEDELRKILEEASRLVDMATARELADRIRHRLEGGFHSDSAELIREDREQ